MGVSFKVAKVGTRYRPKVGLIKDGDHGNQVLEGNITTGEIDPDRADDLANLELPFVTEDFEVSMSLNLLPEGYYVGKTSEVCNDVSTKLLPYNRESDTLFTAIEYGWLPGNVFDDLPCKYVNGAILCEIRDYRSCPSQRSCTVKPLVHRVLLHMCMENVVKDIQSLSDDSWSYEDLLEVESRILKFLQPEINLNPKPLLDKYPGKPLKKINLGLSRAWKRRKRNDGLEPARAATDSSQNQTSNCQSGLVHHGKAAPCSQQAVPVSVQTLQENVIVHSQPAQIFNCLSGLADCGKAAPCSQQALPISVQTLQENAIVHSQPAQNSNHLSGPVHRGKAAPCSQQDVPLSVQTLRENVFVHSQTAQNSNCQPRPVYRSIAAQCSQQAVPTSVRTLQENVIVHSQPNPLMKSYALSNGRGKSAGTVQTSSAIVPPQDQHLNNSGNNVRGRGPLVPVDRGRLAEATQRPVMKQPKLEIVDSFEDQYYARQLQSKNTICQNTNSEIAHHPMHGSPGGIPTPQNGISASIVNETPNMTNTFHRVGAPRIYNPNFVMGMGSNQYNLPSPPLLTANTSSTSSHGTQIGHPVVRSVRSEVEDQKSKALLKEAFSKQRERGFDTSILDLLAGTSSICAENAVAISKGSATLPHYSESQSSLFHRFLKIEEVTQRFQLNERKRKLDRFLLEKPLSRLCPLVGRMLEEDNDIEKQRYPITERTLLSNYFVDKRLNASKTRILVYVLLAHIYNGYEFLEVDTKYKIKMFVTEKLNEQIVEARLFYGEEESPLLLTFPNSHSADLFATQFTFLMAREGYRLATDRVIPISVNAVHSSSSQQLAFMVSNDNQISGVPLQLPSSYGPSPTTTPNTLAGNVTAGEPLQTGRHLPFTANLQPALQLSGNNLSKLAHDVYTQPHLKRAHSVIQIRQQQQLLQRNLMMERLGAGIGGIGPVRMDDGSQGLNAGLRHLDGLLQLQGVGKIPIPGIDNFGQSQNLGSFIADQFLTTAESRGEALMKGVLIQGEAGAVPMPPPFPDMAYVLNNQPPPQPVLHHQKVLRRHPVRPPLQAPASVTATASTIASYLQQTEQQPQLNQGPSSQPMSRENMIDSPQTQSQ